METWLRNSGWRLTPCPVAALLFAPRLRRLVWVCQVDIETLQLFVDVVRHGSFSAVARARDVEVSSVSRGLATLEAELGVRLIQRTTRLMTVTEAGEAFFERVIPLLDAFEAAREAVSNRPDNPSGTLKLTTSVAFGQRVLVPLVPAFRAAFPNIKLELLLSDTNVDLIAERVDLAIRLGSSYGAGVIGSKLMPTRFRVVASPDYIAREGVPAVPGDLANRSCLFFALPEFRTRWLFRQGGKILKVPVHGELVASNALALRDFAIAGLGPTLLGDWLIGPDLAEGTLVDLFPDHDVTATTFDTAAWILYPSRRHLPAKVRIAIDFLRTAMLPKMISSSAV